MNIRKWFRRKPIHEPELKKEFKVGDKVIIFDQSVMTTEFEKNKYSLKPKGCGIIINESKKDIDGYTVVAFENLRGSHMLIPGAVYLIKPEYMMKLYIPLSIKGHIPAPWSNVPTPNCHDNRDDAPVFRGIEPMWTSEDLNLMKSNSTFSFSCKPFDYSSLFKPWLFPPGSMRIRTKNNPEDN